jgi:hypothetical protein
MGYERDGFGAWGIEHCIDRKLIGVANFSIPHQINCRVEMGYTNACAYWDKV